MDIYVKSRGVSIDYFWLKVNENSQISYDPNIPSKIIELIDSDSPSLVLARHQQQIIFLITALDTQNRTDNQNRKIRNSIVWIGEDKQDNEKILRSLIIQYCQNRDEFASQVDDAVDTIPKEGFTVNYKKLPKLSINKKLGDEPPVNTKKVGNLEKLRGNLAEELTNFSLPKNQDLFLIVFSSINTKKNFEQEGVWRGLSNKIEADDWIDSNNGEIKSIKVDFFREVRGTMETDPKNNSKSKILTTILVPILVISLLTNAFLLWKLNDQTLENKRKNIEKEIENLESKKDKLTKENTTLDNKNRALKDQLEPLQKAFKNAQLEGRKILNGLESTTNNLYDAISK